jgi:hypothetical protein
VKLAFFAMTALAMVVANPGEDYAPLDSIIAAVSVIQVAKKGSTIAIK